MRSGLSNTTNEVVAERQRTYEKLFKKGAKSMVMA